MIGESFWGLHVSVIIVVVTVSLMVCHEVGLQLRRRLRAKSLRDLDAESVGGSYLTASLSLLALLVAFSFGMAVDRYNTRRSLVLQEANAISNFYRRTDLMDGPMRAAASRDFLDYLASREAFSRATTLAQLQAAEAHSDAAQRRLWSQIVVAPSAAGPRSEANLISAERMFDLAAERRAALEGVVPGLVLFGMLLYAAIAAALMGYSHPADRRFLGPSSVQFVLLAIALALIVDLDRPRSGHVRVDQAPLLRAAESIRRAEAARTATTVSVPPPAAAQADDTSTSKRGSR